MNLLRKLVYHIAPVFALRKLNAEISEEVRTHLELATAANVAKGMSVTEARQAAERECGRVESAAESYRDQRGVSRVSGWWQDLRQTLRSLLRAKLFTTVVVLTLALGIGSAAAIFSLVDFALFRSINYPEDIVVVGGTTKRGQFNGARLGLEFQPYREQAESLTDYAFAHPFDLNVAVDGEPVTYGVKAVTPNLLPLLNALPALGRSFTRDDLQPKETASVIVSHKFWREYFQGSPDVLGKTVTINERMKGAVVGVLAAGQLLPPNLKSDVFVPLFVSDASPPPGLWHIVFARMKSGVTLAQVDADLARIKVSVPESIAAYHTYTKPHVVTLAEFSAVENRQMYWVLVGAVGFLYAIACLNATNLMVVRIVSRRRELSIRLALGGSHWRIVRLLVIESAIVALVACVLGVLVANWLGPLLRMILDPNAAFKWATWSLDLRALATVVGFTAVTAVIIIVVPAVRILRHDLLDGLKDGDITMGSAPTLARIRRLIVVLQSAFAVVLLTGAGLMVQTLTRLHRVKFGFDESRLVKVQLAFPPGFVTSPKSGMQRLEELRQKLLSVSGVTSVAYGSDTLVSGNYNDGVRVALGDEVSAPVELHFISENFLQTAGLTLLRGTMGDRWGHGILVNETFARALFGDKDPIGQIVRPVEGGESKNQWLVVGVVNDIREMARSAPRNHIYASAEWAVGQASTFIVRVTGTPGGELAALLKRAVYQFDPRVIVAYAVPLTEAIGWQANVEKFVLATLKILSGIALALTIVGLFSLLAYSVEQRLTEFGIRQALGATPRDLVLLVMRASLSLVGVGVVAGLVGAVALSRYLRSLLFETPPYDFAVLCSATAVLIISGVFASLVPAARAARVEISRLLRAE